MVSDYGGSAVIRFCYLHLHNGVIMNYLLLWLINVYVCYNIGQITVRLGDQPSDWVN